MGNGLQNKGHANRRPAVCKKSLPTECPYAELELSTISVLFNTDWTWAIRGLLSLLEGEPVSLYTPKARGVNGNVQGLADVSANIEFTFALENCNPGTTAVVFLKLIDSSDCEYFATISQTIPQNP